MVWCWTSTTPVTWCMGISSCRCSYMLLGIQLSWPGRETGGVDAVQVNRGAFSRTGRMPAGACLAGHARRSWAGAAHGRRLRPRPLRVSCLLRRAIGQLVDAGRDHVARFVRQLTDRPSRRARASSFRAFAPARQRHGPAAADGGASVLRLPRRGGPARHEPGRPRPLRTRHTSRNRPTRSRAPLRAPTLDPRRGRLGGDPDDCCRASRSATVRCWPSPTTQA